VRFARTAAAAPTRRELVMACKYTWAFLAITLGGGLRGLAADKPSVQQIQFFESKIRPLLINECCRCHGSAKQKGGLRLDSRAAMLAGGDRGNDVVPGHPEKSLLIDALQHTGELQMPPGKKLSSVHIADLHHWVAQGSPWPEEEANKKAGTAPSGFHITDRDRSHWAFQPPCCPRVPATNDRTWAVNPIDAFILSRLEARGLHPNPPASRYELIRRVSYDLTGLPPTPQEVDDFARDPSPLAYEGLVDRLLASPHYGERWGRHWLDLVRFAETNSYERDNPKPNAWRYRDYVIRALNQDKPYDQFIREQLAGDELASATPDALIATGYYRLGIWDDEPTDREQARYDGLDDIIATTGQVFLGLTVDCARCHDHKLDPIPQRDYYRLLAFFNNINHYHNGGPTDEVDLGPGRGKALCVTETGRKAPETFILLRGNPRLRGEKVEPGFPTVLGMPDRAPAAPGKNAKTSARRLALANWIGAPDNPLTARVMANRLWQYHFGRGISRSPNNFGLQGEPPTHPELLNWLASELVRQKWRLKPLHRLTVTSNAYRMSSRVDAKALKADPANDLLWRFDMRRLVAEEIRDSLLAATGTLNPQMFGPGIYVQIPKEVMAGQSMPGYGWRESPPEQQARRSVYIHVKRSLLTPILASFDLAETDRPTAVRFSSTQPTQALAMLNGAFLNEQARLLADRLGREAGHDLAKEVRLALYTVLARPPTSAEVREDVNWIDKLSKEEGIAPAAALQCYCLMVLNLNEFIYLD
jgi:hypothetical protein